MTDSTLSADADVKPVASDAGAADPQSPSHSASASVFLAAGFEKGQKVFLFNAETGQLDLPAEVNHVLDAPLKYGALDIPPGSVGVSTGDSAQVWWIRPELIGTMLKAVDEAPPDEAPPHEAKLPEEVPPEVLPSSNSASPGACLSPGGSPAAPAAAPRPEVAAPAPQATPAAAAPAPETAEEKVAQAMAEETQLQKALGWISRSLGMTPWGIKPAAAKAPAPGPAPPKLQAQKNSLPMQSLGDRADSAMDAVPEEEGLSPKPQSGAPTPVSGGSSSVAAARTRMGTELFEVQEEDTGFKRGSLVDVWSNSLEAWESNGVVVDIVEGGPKIVNGVQLPVGSVMVSFRGGLANKWIRPEHISVELRSAQDQPKSAIPAFDTVEGTDQSAPPSQDWKVGDKVMAKNNSTKNWEEAEICDILQEAVNTGSFELPKGCITVSFQGGAQRHVIMPALIETMLRPLHATPADGDGHAGDLVHPKTQVLAPPDAGPDAAGSAEAPEDDAAPAAAPPPAPTPSPDPAPAPAPAPAAPAPAAPAPATAPASAPPSPSTPPAPASAAGQPAAPADGPFDRRAYRVLLIGPGFGQALNPAQGQMLERSGYQICWVSNLPNPETPMFPAAQFLPTIKQAIDEFKPHCVAAASKGGAYLTALWQCGLWAGPSLVINRHPTLVAMPKGINVVVCHGSNDEYYQFRREDLEALIRTGSENRCLLYYTANSGLLGRGYTREGDRHNMQSLLQYDCLPRLIDAVLSSDGPEMQIMRSWSDMVTEERLKAEEWLGFSSHGLRRFWQSQEQKGMDEKVLFEVPVGSEEYTNVATIFRANPRVPRAYHDMNPGMWQEISIIKMERVENGMQEDGSAEPYFNALQRGIENQGMVFRPGLHTRWGFHGSNAIESIISNPISGFQPLMSGSRAQSLWGPGTYFARDAKYVYDGGFCRTAEDGTRQVLLCLLMTGMSCLGDPNHKGVLPMRQGRHRYNSSVDSISNPEIFVLQSPGAAYPAYVITFA